MGDDGTATTALDALAEPGTDYLYRLRMVDRFGNATTAGQATGRRNVVAAGVSLGSPRPNPAMHGTSVTFRIDHTEFVRLSISNVAGRTLRVLHEGSLPAGEHTMTWDGRTDGLDRATPGVYFVTLGTSAGYKTQRVVVTH